jgi:hypothetical protein
MTTWQWTGTTAAVLAAVLASVSSRPQASGVPKPPVKALVAASQAYIATFQSDLAYGVFDEDYSQSVHSQTDNNSRLMHGELFLTFLPTDGDWIAVHDVAVVDGHEVPDRESLAALLQRGTLQSIKSAVIARNARYNIGSIRRNFNEPTLALLVLEPVRVADFDFSIERVVDAENGPALATLRFNEKGDLPATLIRGPQGDQARSKGAFEVEVPSGRIHKTEFALNTDGLSVTLTTFYAHDRDTDLWLPTIFEERYERTKGGPPEVVTCQAKYTNFRRFQVLGRIK